MDGESAQIGIDDLVEKKFRSLKLELKIIAYIIRREYNMIFTINRDFFSFEQYRVVFDIVKKNHMEFPKEILQEMVKKEVSEEIFPVYKKYITKIYETDLTNVTGRNIHKLIARLGKHYESRVIMKTIGDVISLGENFDLDDVKKKLYNATMVNTKNLIDKSLRGDYLEDQKERKQNILEIQKNPNKFAGVPTGISQFDELSGGLLPGEFGIIVGKTGIGKTMALGFFAVNAWLRNYNVLFVSIEMTKMQIGYRFDSRLSRILFSKFRKGELDDADFARWDKRIEDLKKKRNNFLEIVCLPRGCSALDIEREANRIQAMRGGKVDLIVVDYLNLLRTSNASKGNQKDWGNQADVAWELKALSVEYNSTGVALWTGNQLTDEGSTASKIETRHLKYGRAIAEVAPVIIALNQSADDELEDIIKLWIVKCRDFSKVKDPVILHPQFEYMVLNHQAIKAHTEKKV